MEELLLNENQLNEKLKHWQQKLRLQDWIIEVGIFRGRDMLDGASACVRWTLSKKMAFIKVLDPIDYPDNLMGKRNMESELVHELLHLHFAPINEHFSNESNTYDTFEEQAIESITSGLINS